MGHSVSDYALLPNQICQYTGPDLPACTTLRACHAGNSSAARYVWELCMCIVPDHWVNHKDPVLIDSEVDSEALSALIAIWFEYSPTSNTTPAAIFGSQCNNGVTVATVHDDLYLAFSSSSSSWRYV